MAQVSSEKDSVATTASSRRALFAKYQKLRLYNQEQSTDWRLEHSLQDVEGIYQQLLQVSSLAS